MKHREHMSQKAFTIVELIIVIAVIGVLAAILIPTFTGVTQKANAKSALSDARNMLTTYLAEKMDNPDSPLSEHIVIFVNKANKFYVYGWTNMPNDANRGVLMKANNNDDKGYSYSTLSDFIDAFNATTTEYENGNAALEADPNASDPYNGKLFYLLTTAPVTPSVGFKGNSTPELDSKFTNLTSNIKADLPKNVDVFDGVLCGSITQATDVPENTQLPTATVTATDTPSVELTNTPVATINPTVNPTETPVQGYSVTVKFYDTWNEQTTSKTYGAEQLGETTITKEMVQSLLPDFTFETQQQTVNVLTAGTEVTFNGTRDREVNSDGLFRVITTSTGMKKINSSFIGGVQVNGASAIAAKYILNNDIDLELNGQNWVPIGWKNPVGDGGYNSTSSKVFSGVFDGGGHKISGLTMSYNTMDTTNSYVGLFGKIGKLSQNGVPGAVRNLTIDIGNTVITGFGRVGVVAGTNVGTISNTYVINGDSGHTQTSGIVQSNNLDAQAQSTSVGGIVGENNLGGIIEKCGSAIYSINTVSCGGGIAGTNTGTIDQCWSYTGINCVSDTHANIANCIGGIVGRMAESSSCVSNCFANPAFPIRGNSAVGSLIGTGRGTLSCSYAMENGKVTACGENSANVYAAVGEQYYTLNTTASYVVSGLTDNFCSVVTRSELLSMQPIENWDAAIWLMNGTTLPSLKNNIG